jgi:hypothetical protein
MMRMMDIHMLTSKEMEKGTFIGLVGNVANYVGLAFLVGRRLNLCSKNINA